MSVRKVRVLINPKSGLLWSAEFMQKALLKSWDKEGVDLTFQFSLSAEDGKRKTRWAVEEGIDTVLVVGGDGMVNSIGSELINTDVTLGVIPAGSGNGFARHFGIPVNANRAAEALIHAERRRIDVGTVNGIPFFVTCSMAWDASLVRQFEKSPVRGVLPYVFAATYEFFEYKPQPFDFILDGDRHIKFPDPLVCTVANLTQYGGGAQVAPGACPDDGFMELVLLSKQDAPIILQHIVRIFNGTIDEVPEVKTYKFQRLEVCRKLPAPVQMDGELMDASEKVTIEVLPKALSVLVPLDG